MKLVLLEKATLGEGVDWSVFDELAEVTSYDYSTPEEARERVREADIIVCNKVPMNESTLLLAQNLKTICLTATGMNNIDFAYTRRRGISVHNVSGYSTASVIQHTFAMLLYLYEHMEAYREYVVSGEYVKSPMFCHLNPLFHELSRKVFGIVGLGEIGRGVAAVARAFGCHVIYYSTSGKNNNDDYLRVDFDTLLKRADIVSIHAPLNDDTYHLFSEAAFTRMKQGAYLLNLGRGEIVDEQALANALLAGKLGGVGLDVLEREPMRADSPLHDRLFQDRLLITPHIAWGTVEARQRCIDETIRNIRWELESNKAFL